MTRSEWQQLVDERLCDAVVLLDAGRWSAAYYLTGYAVEAALKACIVKRIEADPGLIFEERRFAEECWTHDLKKLVPLAGLGGEHKVECDANKSFEQCWLTTKDWKEIARYKTTADMAAKKLHEAVTDEASGVLQWVKRFW